MGNTYNIRIESLAYGGDALGRMEDGRVVFVPFAIPGELVQVRLVEEKPKHARAELVEVLEASSDRVQPRCQHFGMCGGCHYQHMNYQAQLRAKKAILKEQLARIGKIKELPEVEIIPSAAPWYYRNNIQFHLTSQGKLGFQLANSNQTFPIRECHLPEVGISRLWPQIEVEPTRGLERVSLRQGAYDQLMVVLECSTFEPVDFSIELLPVSVVQLDPSGSLVLAGSDYLVMEILNRNFKVSAASFFQVNTLLGEAMVNYLLENISFNTSMTVLDVYAGVGLFSAFIAPKVKRLIGIEISSEACEDFTTNMDEFENVELYEATAEQVLSTLSFHPDVIVMDPPRTGVGQKTMERVLAQGAATLVYVSCDPATLARDSVILSGGGYKLQKLALIDMFPQTYHIESVNIWKRG